MKMNEQQRKKEKEINLNNYSCKILSNDICTLLDFNVRNVLCFIKERKKKRKQKMECRSFLFRDFCKLRLVSLII